MQRFPRYQGDLRVSYGEISVISFEINHKELVSNIVKYQGLQMSNFLKNNYKAEYRKSYLNNPSTHYSLPSNL